MKKAKSQQEHQAPTACGWELFLKAAEAVRNGDQRYQHDLWGHLIARREEKIPDKYRELIIQAVLDTAPTVVFPDKIWPPDFTNFLDYQVGRAELTKRLRDTPYCIRTCSKYGAPGYVVQSRAAVVRVKKLIDSMGDDQLGAYIGQVCREQLGDPPPRETNFRH